MRALLLQTLMAALLLLAACANSPVTEVDRGDGPPPAHQFVDPDDPPPSFRPRPNLPPGISGPY